MNRFNLAKRGVGLKLPRRRFCYPRMRLSLTPFSRFRFLIQLLLIILIITAARMSQAGSIAGAQEYTPDANTVLLDHFDGSTAAQYMSGSVQYAPGFSNLNQCVSLPSGGWIRETFSPWYTWEDPNSPQGTIELWVNPLSYNVRVFDMQWRNSNTPPSDGYILELSIDANGKLQLYGWQHTDPATNLWENPFPTGDMTIPLNTWTHVAFTWSLQGSYSYVNGDQNGYSPGNYYPGFWASAIPTEYVYLNGWGGSAFGQMDELRLSNIARTQFDTIIPVPEPGTFTMFLAAVAVGSSFLLYRCKWGLKRTSK